MDGGRGGTTSLYEFACMHAFLMHPRYFIIHKFTRRGVVSQKHAHTHTYFPSLAPLPSSDRTSQRRRRNTQIKTIDNSVHTRKAASKYAREGLNPTPSAPTNTADHPAPLTIYTRYIKHKFPNNSPPPRHRARYWTKKCPRASAVEVLVTLPSVGTHRPWRRNGSLRSGTRLPGWSRSRVAFRRTEPTKSRRSGARTKPRARAQDVHLAVPPETKNAQRTSIWCRRALACVRGGCEDHLDPRGRNSYTRVRCRATRGASRTRNRRRQRPRSGPGSVILAPTVPKIDLLSVMVSPTG